MGECPLRSSGSKMKNPIRKVGTVLTFTIALLALRLVDSIFSYELYKAGGGIELNPLADPTTIFGVFLSPGPLAIATVTIVFFGWMVIYSEKVLEAESDSRESFVKRNVGAPFLILFFIAVAVLNNVFFLFTGRPIMPKAVNDFIVEYPLVGLVGLVALLDIIGGRFFRKAMLSILHRVSAP